MRRQWILIGQSILKTIRTIGDKKCPSRGGRNRTSSKGENIVILTYFDIFRCKMFLTGIYSVVLYLFPEVLIHFSSLFISPIHLSRHFPCSSSFATGSFQIPIPLVLRQEPQPKTAVNPWHYLHIYLLLYDEYIVIYILEKSNEYCTAAKIST